MIIEKLLLELKKEIDKEIEKRDNTIRSLREDKNFSRHNYWEINERFRKMKGIILLQEVFKCLLN